MLKNVLQFWKREKKNDLIQSEEELLASLDPTKIPRHVAIIMDGNGRWASRRGMPRVYGHRMGMKSLKEAVKVSVELKLDVLTVYAFSTENWKRPQTEVDFLMNLLVEYMNKEIDELCENNVQVSAIGRIEALPLSAQKAITYALERTKNNTGLIFNLALNYGGRTELVDAVKNIGAMAAQGQLDPKAINEQTISGQLYTAGQPDPDLLIRPSGDYRISNFLLWQMAYTEFWHTNVLWPDFRKIHMLQAVAEYQKRERRFGGLKK